MMPRALAVLPLVALALLPIACGDEDETTSSTTTSTTTSTATEAGDFSGEPRVYFGFLKATDVPGGKPGALVRSLDAGSPIGTAGLAEGDVIVSVDGQQVADAKAASSAFADLSTTHDPGDQVKIEVERGSKSETLTVQLAPNVLLGADVREGTAGSPGVAVVAVTQGDPADVAGVKAGDFVTAADGTRVEDVGELFAVLGEHTAGEEVGLTIVRGTRELTLTPTLKDRTQGQ